jgi:hypothetical protein
MIETMKRIFVAVAVLSFAVLNVQANEGKFRRSSRPAKGQYIVMLEAQPRGTDLEVPLQALTKMYGGEVMHKYRGAPWEGFSLKNLPEAAAIALSRDPRVKLVEEDGLVEVLQAAPQHTQWALDRTNQTALPLDNVTSAGCVGTSMVHIYIMDTGINDPSGTIFGTRLIHGYRDPSIATFDDNYGTEGHGTAVATIAGGATYGVATGAKIVNVKVVGAGLGSAAAIAAIRNFINVHPAGGPKVVNMSLLYPESAALETEIANSVNTHLITYVVGAGNGDTTGYGIDACWSGSPSSMGGGTNGVITVGASYLENNYMTDNRSEHPFGDGKYGGWSSNFGSCVDIFAPGTRVAAYHRNGTLMEFSGTSAASPYVAGAAARRQAIHWSSYGTIKAPWDVEASVKADATPGVLNNIGAGSPNLLLYRFYLRCRAVG